MTEVVMPQMGESIVEGTLTRWLKKSGEHVERDEPLFEISTDKVDTEIPSPAAGTLGEILVQEGTTVGINTVVGRIAEAGSTSNGASAPAPAPAQSAPAPAASAPPAPVNAAPVNAAPVNAAPAPPVYAAPGNQPSQSIPVTVESGPMVDANGGDAGPLSPLVR